MEDYKELAEKQALKIKIIKETLKEVLKYINTNIYTTKSGSTN